MRKASIGLAPEGAPIIGLLTVTSLTFGFSGYGLFAIISLLLLFFSVYFFRDPERVAPSNQELAVSPADGKIIRIRPMIDPISGKERTCISIFMNVFSVHVNRAPIAGTIKKIEYFPGLFVNAAFDKASTDNERCAYSLEDTEKKMWTFVQISGLIARRIVCRAEIGDTLARAERFGLIRFGSRVDLFLPEEYCSAVNVGDIVFAGQTAIAKKI